MIRGFWLRRLETRSWRTSRSRTAHSHLLRRSVVELCQPVRHLAAYQREPYQFSPKQRRHMRQLESVPDMRSHSPRFQHLVRPPQTGLTISKLHLLFLHSREHGMICNFLRTQRTGARWLWAGTDSSNMRKLSSLERALHSAHLRTSRVLMLSLDLYIQVY